MQELPCRIGTGKNSSRDRWSSRGGQYHRVNGIFPWKRVKRLLKNSLGKHFDIVFSDYCKNVPVYQQEYFLMKFKERPDGYCLNDYYIDENGLIQRYSPSNRYKGPYTFYSIDCVIEKRHKITGKKESEYYWFDKKYNADGYESVIVQGWIKQFDSKNDPEFKKLKTEKQIIKNKAWQIKYGHKEISDEDYRIILKAKELKEREKNLIKIEAHGFDPITSFRKEKKTK